MWKNTAIQVSNDTEYYLTMPSHAVEFTALRVEEMMNNGSTNEEINAFLIQQSAVYSIIIDSNNTGVYGYCRGEYLDVSGWIPEADYVPEEMLFLLICKKLFYQLAEFS